VPAVRAEAGGACAYIRNREVDAETDGLLSQPRSCGLALVLFRRPGHLRDRGSKILTRRSWTVMRYLAAARSHGSRRVACGVGPSAAAAPAFTAATASACSGCWNTPVVPTTAAAASGAVWHRGRLTGPRRARGQRGAGRFRLGAFVGPARTSPPGRYRPGAGCRPVWAAAVTSHGWSARRACTGPRLVRQPQLKGNSPLPI
jgi:hypothetical protein